MLISISHSRCDQWNDRMLHLNGYFSGAYWTVSAPYLNGPLRPNLNDLSFVISHRWLVDNILRCSMGLRGFTPGRSEYLGSG
jgi:hypothetical protein